MAVIEQPPLLPTVSLLLAIQWESLRFCGRRLRRDSERLLEPVARERPDAYTSFIKSGNKPAQPVEGFRFTGSSPVLTRSGTLKSESCKCMYYVTRTPPLHFLDIRN